MTESFEFAGFTFPRHIPQIVRKGNRWGIDAAYYASPKPNKACVGFYLESDFAPSLRWMYADDVSHSGIDHQGWYMDEEYSGGDTIRGVVFRLPHGRGFLAGTTMGTGMSSTIDTSTVWDSDDDAARDADRQAERMAEDERAYRSDWHKGVEAADLEATARNHGEQVEPLKRQIRAARKAGLAEVVVTLQAKLNETVDARAEARDALDALIREYGRSQAFQDGRGTIG